MYSKCINFRAKICPILFSGSLESAVGNQAPSEPNSRPPGVPRASAALKSILNPSFSGQNYAQILFRVSVVRSCKIELPPNPNPGPRSSLSPGGLEIYGKPITSRQNYAVPDPSASVVHKTKNDPSRHRPARPDRSRPVVSDSCPDPSGSVPPGPARSDRLSPGCSGAITVPPPCPTARPPPKIGLIRTYSHLKHSSKGRAGLEPGA